MLEPRNIRQIGRTRAVLGESVRYDTESDTLLWLDIPESVAWKIGSDGREVAISLGAEAAFACLADNDQILAGGNGGLFLDGAPVRSPLLSSDEVLNDGAVHPTGRFVVFGSRDRAEVQPLGHMWCLGHTLKQLPWSFTVFNGPTFSPTGDRIYIADSAARTIYTAPVDAERQLIGDRSVFAVVPDHLGYPDGMACDAEGALWSAHWDGHCITRYLQEGSVDYRFEVPVRRPTSLAFKGSTLFFASAQLDDPCVGDTADGCLFAFDTDVAGIGSPRLAQSVIASLS